MSTFMEKEHLSPHADVRQPVYAAKSHHIEQCRACQCCVLACSYHHRRVFSPAFSSIAVSRNNQNGIVQWAVDSTCDDCTGEAEHLCARYCAYGVLTVAGGGEAR